MKRPKPFIMVQSKLFHPASTLLPLLSNATFLKLMIHHTLDNYHSVSSVSSEVCSDFPEYNSADESNHSATGKLGRCNGNELALSSSWLGTVITRTIAAVSRRRRALAAPPALAAAWSAQARGMRSTPNTPAS